MNELPLLPSRSISEAVPNSCEIREAVQAHVPLSASGARYLSASLLKQ